MFSDFTLTKNQSLHSWFWKWHVIAGLISLPFMFLLAVTGTIYLFKDNVNEIVYAETLQVQRTFESQTLPLTEQLYSAQQASDKPIASVTITNNPEQATEFKVLGKGRASNSIYIDPYTGDVTGSIAQPETLMHKIRKLHGELLLGKPGTLVIELVASWFIVLILTGLYLWWPPKGSGLAGFFTVRTHRGRRLFWRDIHVVVGFWLSAFMLIILAGGMPWTDVFGDQLKWVQKQTNSGYPTHWRNSKGIESQVPTGNHSAQGIDAIAEISQQLGLPGKVTITLPQSPNDVYRVSNRSLYLEDQQVIHLDQYSGQVIKSLNWDDVGVLMDLRQIFMRLHQGEYGKVNWVILFVVALLFSLTTLAGLISYLLRKPAGRWGIPKTPARFQVDKLLLLGIIALGVVFPLFGISLVLLFLSGLIRRGVQRRIQAG